MSLDGKKLFDCHYEYTGYTLDVAAESKYDAEDVARGDVQEYVDRAKDNERMAREDLRMDLGLKVECEVVEDGDPRRGGNYDEHNDRLSDDELYY